MQIGTRNYKEDVLLAIRSLSSDDHRLVFALASCERLLPNYATFNRLTRFGSFRLLHYIMNVAWRHPTSKNVDDATAQAFIDACGLLAPHTEESFDTGDCLLHSGDAVSACGAVAEALAYILKPDDMSIFRATNNSYSTVASHALLQMTGGKTGVVHTRDWEVAEASEIVQREIAKQNSEIEWLSAHLTLTESLVESFRKSATYDGRSNLGFQIEPADLALGM